MLPLNYSHDFLKPPAYYLYTSQNLGRGGTLITAFLCPTSQANVKLPGRGTINRWNGAKKFDFLEQSFLPTSDSYSFTNGKNSTQNIANYSV